MRFASGTCVISHKAHRMARSLRDFVAARCWLFGAFLAISLLSADPTTAATYTAQASGCGYQSNVGLTSPQTAGVVQQDCTASWYYGNASAISSEFGLGVSADGVSSCCGHASIFEALAQVGTQFIIYGPTSTVETSLNLHFEASFPSGVVPGYSKREARIDLIMSQATFGTVGIYFGLYRDVADSGGRAFTYGGDLSQIPGVVIPGGESLDGISVTPTFVVPVGVPVDITLALRGSVENIGDAAGGLYAMDALYFPLSGPVFNLPDGYTATFDVAVAPGSVAVAPISVDFGDQSMFTPSIARIVTISNTSAGAALISAMNITGPFAVRSHTCGALPALLASGASCTAQLTFTPPGEGAYNGSLTVVSSTGNVAVQLSGFGERSLVTHYYVSILGRNPDAAGKAWWEDQVDRMQGLGADINEVWYAMAMGFFNSTEYLGFGKTDGEFVDDLYRTFLNREPETDGRNFWLAQIAQGLTREVVLVAFMFSDEFRQFTASIFGDTSVRPELNMVMDFYRGLLSRLPDDAGFDFWVLQFRKAQCTGAAAVTAEAEAISSGFVTGPEYANRNRTNSQYLGDLYNAILRRGGDAAGVNFWKGLLDSKTLTREQVRQQFVQGPEFQGRVAQIIAAGCVP